MLAPWVRLSELVNESETIQGHFLNLNMLAPAMLTNVLSRRYDNVNSIKIVCNIASGAAHKPLEVG